MTDYLMTPDYYRNATRDHIEECIADKCLEPEILMSYFHGIEIDFADAANLLWEDLKPAVSSRIINEWIADNEAKFAELYNEWWADHGFIEYEYREE